MLIPSTRSSLLISPPPPGDSVQAFHHIPAKNLMTEYSLLCVPGGAVYGADMWSNKFSHYVNNNSFYSNLTFTSHSWGGQQTDRQSHTNPHNTEVHVWQLFSLSCLLDEESWERCWSAWSRVSWGPEMREGRISRIKNELARAGFSSFTDSTFTWNDSRHRHLKITQQLVSKGPAFTDDKCRGWRETAVFFPAVILLSFSPMSSKMYHRSCMVRFHSTEHCRMILDVCWRRYSLMWVPLRGLIPHGRAALHLEVSIIIETPAAWIQFIGNRHDVFLFISHWLRWRK